MTQHRNLYRTLVLFALACAVALAPAQVAFADAIYSINLPLVVNKAGGAVCTAVPTLTSPANGATLTTLNPLFQWNTGNDTHTTLAGIEISKTANFSAWGTGFETAYSTTGDLDFMFDENFEEATVYYWRAYVECGSERGTDSQTFSFTTPSGGVKPAAPTLSSPTNGSASVSRPVALKWNAVGGAQDYFIFVMEKSSSSTSWLQTSGAQVSISWLSPGTTYDWWITARNDYAIGSESAHWTFTTAP